MGSTSPFATFAGAILPTPSPLFQYQNYAEQPNQYQKVIITTAQLLALNGAPVTIAPAGGAGTLLVPDGLSARYIAGNTGFTIGVAVLKLYIGSVTGGHALTANFATGLVDQTSNKILPFIPLISPTTVDTDANFLNQAIVIGNDNATQLTLGNGSLEVLLEYSTMQV
jgi:hypothetical protein